MTEWTLYAKELRALRWIWIVGALVVTVIGAVLGPAYDFLFRLLADVPIPEAFLGLIEQQLGDFDLYLWANWYGKNLLQAVVVLALLVGAGAIAGEAGRSTLEFLLARPVSRRQVVWAKAAAGITVLWSLTLPATLAAGLGGVAAGHALDWGRFLLGLPGTLAAGAVIYAVALVFSVLTTDLLRAGVVGGLALAPLMVAGWFGKTAWVSPFHYMRGSRVFAEQALPYPALAGLLLAAAILIWLAARLFESRDV